MIDFEKLQSIYLGLHEYNSSNKRDKYDRFIPDESSEWIHQPIVSNYLFQKGFCPVYPGNKKMAVCISHDIDRLFEIPWSTKTLLNQQAKTLFKLNFSKWKENFSYTKRKIHPLNDLNRWLDIEREYGIHASYYFLSLNKEEADFNYQPMEVKEIIRSVRKNGHEVGLHGGHLAYKDSEKMKSEKELLESALGSEVLGYRNHYLRFDIKQSWKAMIAAGFEYDSTFGHATISGYRNGMAYPFQYADENKNLLPFHVLPLIIMDGTLDNYLKLNSEQSYQHIIEKIDQIKEVNGVFTLLWHNNNCKGDKVNLFKRVLQYLESLDPWYATGSEIIDYYKNENYFQNINHSLKIG